MRHTRPVATARVTWSVLSTLMAACLLLGAVSTAPVHAVTHFGKVTAMPHNQPKDGYYKVKIVAVNGEDADIASHKKLPVGNHTVTVALLRNRAWMKHLEQVPEDLPHKTLKIRVKNGMTHLLGARVDLEATPEAQRDGSFWEPVVTDEFRAR